jgi:hypothetical protein
MAPYPLSPAPESVPPLKLCTLFPTPRPFVCPVHPHYGTPESRRANRRAFQTVSLSDVLSSDALSSHKFTCCRTSVARRHNVQLVGVRRDRWLCIPNVYRELGYMYNGEL